MLKTVPKKGKTSCRLLHIFLCCGFFASSLISPLPVSAQYSTSENDEFVNASYKRQLADKELSAWHVRQAQRYRNDKEFLKALMHAERALDIDPASEDNEKLIVRLRRDYDKQMKKLSKVTHYVKKALEAEEAENESKALRYWKKARKLAEGDPRVEKGYQSFLERFDSKVPRLVKANELVAHNAVAAKPKVSEYLISSGDVLEVFVWQQPDLSRNVIVRPDGRISFPLAGDLVAAGNTLVELDQQLTDRLKTYVRYPDVSLAIRRFGGTKTIVMGEVGSPGIYVPTGEGSVLEVIAMAGGFKSTASQNDVLLIRGGLNQPQIAKLQLQDVLRRGDLHQNVAVSANDIIYVPKQEVKDVLAWVEQFFPILSNILVGQSVATNFGTYETSGAAAAR